MTEQQLIDNFNLAADDLITHMEKYESSRLRIMAQFEYNYQQAIKALNQEAA